MKELAERVEIGGEEVQIFENEQYETSRENADQQRRRPPSSRCPFDVDRRQIVDDDGDEQYQDIDRDEGHVEDAARDQEQHPPIAGRQEEVERRDDWEKGEKLQGVEQHVTAVSGKALAKISQRGRDVLP